MCREFRKAIEAAGPALAPGRRGNYGIDGADCQPVRLSARVGWAREVAVQRGLGDAGLGRDLAERVSLAVEEPGILDLFFGVGDGPANMPSGGFGDGPVPRRITVSLVASTLMPSASIRALRCNALVID